MPSAQKTYTWIGLNLHRVNDEVGPSVPIQMASPVFVGAPAGTAATIVITYDTTTTVSDIDAAMLEQGWQ
jgi:hypothetical protein